MSRVPFTEQLNALTGVTLPVLGESERSVEDVDRAVDRVLEYFSIGRDVLSGLDAQDDVEWMFEGREAILNVGKTIMKAGELMDQLMTVLEQTKECNNNGSSDKQASKRYIPVIEKIERAITEWHKILELIQAIRNQVDIATEWKDLNDQILTEVEDEISHCYSIIFEIEENRHFPAVEKVDIDSLTTALNESPFIDQPRLPTLSQVERTVNDKFIEVSTRLKPLQASLDFIPLRLEQYGAKADDVFPSSVKTLNAKHLTLRSNLDELVNEVKALQKELGEDRWSTIFKNTGVQASEMLDSYQENLDLINLEKRKAKLHNRSVDVVKVERLATKNAHLSPAIDRILALLDRALRDHLTGNSEMYQLQANLHKRWKSLTLVKDQNSNTHHKQVDNSPLTAKSGFTLEDLSSISSSNTSWSSTSSTHSPLSSIDSSPTLSQSFKPKDNNNNHRLSLLPVPSASPRPMNHVESKIPPPTPTQLPRRSLPSDTNNFSRPLSRLRKSSISQCDTRIPQTPSRVVSETVRRKPRFSNTPSMLPRPSSPTKSVTRKTSLPGFMQPRKVDLVNQQLKEPSTIKRPNTVTGLRSKTPSRPPWR
ncbi:hypothetical protein TRICI_006780 [Trichomonascus ciferrii]|uniref:Karyogamy protein n=1 Tax=Trichomonascus ciferrii TaxID=44093 RepID=A0A642UFX6_9ASCO|nr:hypothetical protein TRICI_006780 [Trichomonascus ciferrii]